MESKDIIEYFRSNIYESLAAYNGWKMIAFSASTKIVSKEMAERYVEIQNYNPDFFNTVKKSFVVHFVLFTLHSFDKREDSLSLFKVDADKTTNFLITNKGVIKKLKLVRHKLFAHKSIEFNSLPLPSVPDLDSFFKKLIDFYNELTKDLDGSVTSFSNAENIKDSVERLFINLYRGEAVRKKEIDIEWQWRKSDQKASDLL